jgi:hypothetical protein
MSVRPPAANVNLLCRMGVVPFSLQWMSAASDLPSIQKHAAEVLVLLSYDRMFFLFITIIRSSFHSFIMYPFLFLHLTLVATAN